MEWRCLRQTTAVLLLPSLPQVTGEDARLIAGQGGWQRCFPPLPLAGGCHRAQGICLPCAAALLPGALCLARPWQHNVHALLYPFPAPHTPPVRPS